MVPRCQLQTYAIGGRIFPTCGDKVDKKGLEQFKRFANVILADGSIRFGVPSQVYNPKFILALLSV